MLGADDTESTPARLQEQLVLFCDFLGFKEACKREKEMEILLAGLMEVAELRGNAQNGYEKSSDGVTSGTIRPAVSTFSDHVVVSYPLFPDGEISPDSLMLPLIDAKMRAGYVASVALQAGMLIRGGLALGKLFHSDGVVFGDGLISAYELESKVAIYPRIAVQPRLLNIIPRHIFAGVGFVQDQDGVHDFDYFSSLSEHALGIPVTGDHGERYYVCLRTGEEFHDPDIAARWLEKQQRTIATRLAEFQPDDLGAFTKWAWFQSQFTRRLGEALSDKPEQAA